MENKINNQELEKILDELGKERSKSDLEKIMPYLQKTSFFVPMQLPGDYTAQQLKQLDPAKVGEVFKENPPQPVLLQNEQGQKYLPLYTSEQQIPTNEGYGLVMVFPFSICTNMLVQLSDVKGLSINAFTHNFMIDKGVQPQKKKDSGKKKLSAKHVPSLLRGQVENNDIPFRLHQEKGEFMKLVDEKRETFIYSFYESLFKKNKLRCPFQAKDIEVMYLGVTENIDVARVTLPSNASGPGMAKLLFLVNDKAGDCVHYYSLVKGLPGEKDFIGEVLSNGARQVVADAPKEGNELHAIMEILGVEI